MCVRVCVCEESGLAYDDMYTMACRSNPQHLLGGIGFAFVWTQTTPPAYTLTGKVVIALRIIIQTTCGHCSAHEQQ